MTVNVLFAAKAEKWGIYEAPLNTALQKAGVAADVRTDFAPAEVDYIVYAPNSNLQDFTPYTRAKAVLNLWAGVEDVVHNQTLTIPLARMVDEGLTLGMVEWVVGHTLRHHLGMDRHILGQDGVWRPDVPPLTKDRPVTVLGMGELGRACAQALVSIGFPVTGWSRSPRDVAGVRCLSGDSGFEEALRGAQIVILLLPLTPDTTNVIDAKALNLMEKGAFIVNPGRGPLIDDTALLAALDRGQIGHATLDVFRVEPLTIDHPYWAHPNVTVTPHIASATREDTASMVIAENIRRGEAGEPFVHLVNRDLGY